MFIVSSESDCAVGKGTSSSVWGCNQVSTKILVSLLWQCIFPQYDDFCEGNDYQNLLIAIAKAYVESDLTWTEVEEIGDRIAQGETFNSVAKLNLSQRVSPDMVDHDNERKQACLIS